MKGFCLRSLRLQRAFEVSHKSAGEAALSGDVRFSPTRDYHVDDVTFLQLHGDFSGFIFPITVLREDVQGLVSSVDYAWIRANEWLAKCGREECLR